MCADLMVGNECSQILRRFVIRAIDDPPLADISHLNDVNATRIGARI
jgi:hypothetical protein